MSKKLGTNTPKIRKKTEITPLKKDMQDKLRQYYDLNINSYTAHKATGFAKDTVYKYFTKWDKELEELAPINSLISRDNEKIKVIQQLDVIRLSLENQLSRIKTELTNYNLTASSRASLGATIYKTSSFFLENKKSELEAQIIQVLDLRTSIVMMPPSQAILLQHIAEFNKMNGIVSL